MFELLLVVHFLSLVSSLGISIALFVLGLYASTLPPGDAAPLMGRVAGAVRHVNIVGITLLVLSGMALALVAGHETVQAGGWWFRAKLVAVAVVVIAFILARINQVRAHRGTTCRSQPTGRCRTAAPPCRQPTLRRSSRSWHSNNRAESCSRAAP